MAAACWTAMAGCSGGPTALGPDAVPADAAARPVAVAPAPSPPTRGEAAASKAAEAADDELLKEEDKEADPTSAKVTVRISVEPGLKTTKVFWGHKDLGKLPIELERDRNSGPLDLVITAPGFLTVHTRAYTDRDDKLSVRMVPETDASRLLGWKPTAPGATPAPTSGPPGTSKVPPPRPPVPRPAAGPVP